MKKILIIALSVLIFASCADKLKVEPTSVMGEKSKARVLDTLPDRVLAGAEVGMYVHFATTYSDHMLSGVPGFAMTFGLMGNDMPMILGHSMNYYDYRFEYRAENYIRSSFFWNFYYKNIAEANRTLLSINALEAAGPLTNVLKNYKARALTFRAFAYFHLANIYQFPYSEANKDLPSIPKSTEATLGIDQPRASLADMYQFIIDDVKEATKLFGETGYNDLTTKGDVDASVANMIGARVELIRGNWTDAGTYSDKVLAKYTLLAKSNIQNGFGNIDNVSSAIWGFYMTPDNGRTYASFFSQMDPYMAGYAGLWGERPIHSYLYSQIPATDVRRKWWINKVDNPNINWPGTVGTYPCQLPVIAGANTAGIKARSEYVSVKFFTKGANFNTTDYMYMRAEEALFIKAEALAQNNDLTGAKTVINNWVKTYRDASYNLTSTVKADVIKAIHWQRRVELWMENGIENLNNRRLGYPVDRRDVVGMESIKNNHLDKLYYEQSNKILFYQLPLAALNANKELTQNE